MNSDQLIQACLENDAKAQRQLFELYAGKMMSLCMRYAKSRQEAEDFLQEGFIRLFKYLDKYEHKGSFDGWVRRIFVNTAIKHYHTQVKHNQVREISIAYEKSYEASAISMLSENELLQVIEQLPDGYRLVFNLYAIEGFSHKEIGVMLNIGESTSRSQLVKARKWLQSKILIKQKVAI